MPSTAVIIDDENMARSLLVSMLALYCPHVAVAAEAADLPNGVKAIRKQKPDIVFLDIEMPGHSGLDLLDFFEEEEVDFKIIFVTAYHQYAIRAFKLSAVDYLLKPLESSALIEAVSKAEKSKIVNVLPALRYNLASQSLGKLAVHTVSEIRFIPLAQILFLKAAGAYTEVFLAQEQVISSRNLKYFEEALSEEPDFIRCHKSFMVNLTHIGSYVKTDGGYLKVENHSVSLSADKIDEILFRMRIR